MRACVLIPAAAVAFAGVAQAGVPVEVTVTGVVEFNQINPPPLGDVMPGDPATLAFTLDSDDFVNSMNFPTRGYVINPESFVLTMGAVTMPLADIGETAYFTLRDNDPAVDGFFVANNVDFVLPGVALDQFGFFDWFRNAFHVTYGGDTLDSLDILDALGTYDFTGLTVFNWTVDDGPFNPLGMVFEQMTIEADVALDVPFDIKPGSCPNSFNRGSRGKLPTAILGTMDFDVSMIDADSVLLMRADGVGGALAPLRAKYGDVATPYDGDMMCGCNEMYSDGFMDLKLTFLSQDVVMQLELGEFMGGDMVELLITGVLADGTPFIGADCIRIVPIGNGGAGPMGLTTRNAGIGVSAGR